MASPFRQIRIDGRLLDGPDIARWAEALVRTHDGASWARSLADTLKELVEGDGGLTARSSGTTGPPKTFTIPADDLVASARLTMHTFGLLPGDRALLCLPCDFIAGKLMLVRAFVCGLDLHVIDPGGGVLGHLGDERPFRFAALVPHQLQRALQEDSTRAERLFDTILLGGGPVPAALEEALHGFAPNVFHGYGSTETVTHVAVRALNGPSRSPHFTALGKVTFFVDEEGRAVIRTPHLHVQEHRTNDVIELVDARRFRWLGRFDHVVLSGGKKIFPEELEARTARVLDRPHFFTALADDALGQCVALVIEGDALTEAEEALVRAKLAEVLTKHERPKRILALRAFRRTSGGKIIRALDGWEPTSRGS